MVIKIIGSGCEDCNKLYANAWAALMRSGREAEIERVEDLVEMVKLGIMSTPTVMIDGKVVVYGRTADESELLELIKKA